MCPVCGSIIKSQRLMVDSYYGQKIWCSDNWHWTTPLLTGDAPPAGWPWTVEDDMLLKKMDLAFQMPLERIQEIFHYLRR